MRRSFVCNVVSAAFLRCNLAAAASCAIGNQFPIQFNFAINNPSAYAEQVYNIKMNSRHNCSSEGVISFLLFTAASLGHFPLKNRDRYVLLSNVTFQDVSHRGNTFKGGWK